jgi:hypothetical protein
LLARLPRSEKIWYLLTVRNSRQSKQKASGRPLEEKSVAKLMALANDLARQNPRQDALQEDLRPGNEDREVQRDRQVQRPTTDPRRRKRNRELIVGWYLLLIIGLVVFVARTFIPSSPVRTTTEPEVITQSQSAEAPSSDSKAPNRPGMQSSTNNIVRFAQFGCASATCTLSCEASERIMNAFMLGSGATFIYENDQSVTVKPPSIPSAKIVLVCQRQQ